MIVKLQILRRFVSSPPVSMLCDVSCDDDKMQNVGTVAVGVLACWRYLSPVSTFRCMFGHLVSPSPSPQHQPPEDGKCRKKLRVLLPASPARVLCLYLSISAPQPVMSKGGCVAPGRSRRWIILVNPSD